ncbi:MAG: GntR family transcriptional regulator [Solirubrobacterales bacterium]|nr:MAG: GntR family transcriptional regulator [Solirubrobacterales bacterium]
MLELGQYQITGSTAREISASAEAVIREGGLGAGDLLPTMRSLAESLGISPATVNSAYRILRQRGLVVAEGRRGTRVAARPALRAPVRPSQQPSADIERWRDLAIGLPDPALLPALPAAVAQIDVEARLRFATLDGPDRELLAVARGSFERDGIATHAIAVVAGALDGIERILHAHLRAGDRVVIEDPAYPSIRDIVRALGLVAVPVAVDERGLAPGALRAAMKQGVQALVVVPRAQNPLGSALDAERVGELRGVLDKSPGLLLVEDDHAGAVSGAPFSTLTDPDRSRWAVIRSVSKVLHPDLRLAVVAGDEATIARVEGRQALGPRWVSHLLQAIAAEMLGAPRFGPLCARAAHAYAERRGALIAALGDRGVAAYGRSGLNVWVPVREEAPVVGALLDAGWLVLAGESFRIKTGPGVRITISTLRDGEAEELARVIARVEHAGRPRRAY